MKKSIIIVVLVLMSLTTNTHAWPWSSPKVHTTKAGYPIATSRDKFMLAQHVAFNGENHLLKLMVSRDEVAILRQGLKVNILEETSCLGPRKCVKIRLIGLPEGGETAWTYLDALE